MELYQKPIMQEKGMFLRKNSFLYFYFFIYLTLSTHISVLSDENKSVLVKNYLNELKFFSASFIQDDGLNISEGRLFIGDQRVRVEYSKPTKILIILGKSKGMYYNYELEEDEFFDPKDTPAWFFYDTFNNLDFFNDALLNLNKNSIVIEKKGSSEIGEFIIKVFFEDNPLILRRIKLELSDDYTSLSFFDHKYNETFDDRFFKLINPIFFD